MSSFKVNSENPAEVTKAVRPVIASVNIIAKAKAEDSQCMYATLILCMCYKIIATAWAQYMKEHPENFKVVTEALGYVSQQIVKSDKKKHERKPKFEVNEIVRLMIKIESWVRYLESNKDEKITIGVTEAEQKELFTANFDTITTVQEMTDMDAKYQTLINKFEKCDSIGHYKLGMYV